MVASREIHPKSRPIGLPRKDNFALVTVEVPGPGPGHLLVRNLLMMVGKRLTMRGFIVSDFLGRYQEAFAPMMKWYHEGRLNARSTVHEGIEHATDALIGLFEGTNTGKMLVNLCSHEQHGIEVEYI